MNSMSVHETDTVDYIYLEDASDEPVLVVSDPLGWTPPEEEPHIELLTEKLNTQIAFVNSGQIVQVWPEFRDGKVVWVEVAGRCALSARAEDFYHHAGRVLAEANMRLRFMLLA
jgi:hypothetical protein